MIANMEVQTANSRNEKEYNFPSDLMKVLEYKCAQGHEHACR